jgi:tRNA nucleotidyltransferase/poly(A) polymerase
MVKTFEEYKQLREASENKDDKGGGDVATSISLGKGNDYEPFQCSDDPKSEHYGKNSALSPIVRAFKGGGNWGWSKDDTSGDDKPVKISGKKLYLAGGSVRSHLIGEKGNGDIQLATNASPDEVYHLMKQNGFEFVTDKGSVKGSKDPNPNKTEGSKQSFWVEMKNKNGRPFTFGVNVNGTKFKLDTFRKARGKMTDDDEPEPGTMGDDSNSRDFSMNSMYIELGNENGQNDKLTDHHGGVHHMASGKVSPNGGMDSMKGRPDKMIRYMRFMNSYGDNKNMSTEDKQFMSDNAPSLGKLDRKYMMGEFKKGMDKEGCDQRGFLKSLASFGMLDHMFPGKNIDTDFPKELSELGDKQAPMAWMLRMNDPSMLEDEDMDADDMKKIKFLIKSLGMTENMDQHMLEDLMAGYTSSGISGRKLREWGIKMGKLDGSLMDAFIAHAKSPRVKVYQINDEGVEGVDNAFLDLFDPFTGQKDVFGIDERKRNLELDGFRKQVDYMRPI